MLTIVVLSILITGFSILTLSISINDAEAVNVAGSLRMQSYRLANDIRTDSKDYDSHILMFDHSIHSNAMLYLTDNMVPQPVQDDYQELLTQWEKVKAVLNSGDRHDYLDHVASFVAQIDSFVLKLQQMSENMLTRLAWVGGMGLVGIFFIGLYVVLFVRREVVGPMNDLLLASEQVQNQQFDIQLDESNKSEMGTLAKTFNEMAYGLGNQYHNLERIVDEKTNRLRKLNYSLELLYDSAQQLSLSRVDPESLSNILKNIVYVEGIKAVKLQIDESHESSQIYKQGDLSGELSVEHRLYFNGESLGYLYFEFDLVPPDQAIVDSFIQLFAQAISYYRSQRQVERLILMEERATIARELHDSLAQSLSYLKIQVSRLKKLSNQDNNKLVSVISELDIGLSSAYTQLRELLATFRLHIKEGSFGLALSEVVNQLSSQTKATILCNSELSSLDLSSNQQVHLLQLIREAILNAIKHAKAEHIWIDCTEVETEVIITIKDDGIGFDAEQKKDNHYGISIMRERALRLNGSIIINSKINQGSEVVLTYPKVENEE
ncbi:nitrate/nitrite two-component system sensor histidine kinase NarQ [Vibrio marisflavi]|nr:nitrate/nitrite two-component system sensor histidine kinase NarQ [Vibrio marisflavi]